MHIVKTLRVLGIAKIVTTAIALIISVALFIIRRDAVIHHSVRINTVRIAMSHMTMVRNSWL
jgi:ABC-type methionine transport system permease subunit